MSSRLASATRLLRVNVRVYNLIGYGNEDITGEIDLFLARRRGLKISAEEQVEFLRQLYEGELPFSERLMNIVRELIVLEEGERHRLSGKTGWVSRVEPQVGWFVGYSEVGDSTYIFATNVERESSESLGR